MFNELSAWVPCSSYGTILFQEMYTLENSPETSVFIQNLIIIIILNIIIIIIIIIWTYEWSG